MYQAQDHTREDGRAMTPTLLPTFFPKTFSKPAFMPPGFPKTVLISRFLCSWPQTPLEPAKTSLPDLGLGSLVTVNVH
jgi:hypothetical protein